MDALLAAGDGRRLKLLQRQAGDLFRVNLPPERLQGCIARVTPRPKQCKSGKRASQCRRGREEGRGRGGGQGGREGEREGLQGIFVGGVQLSIAASALGVHPNPLRQMLYQQPTKAV